MIPRFPTTALRSALATLTVVGATSGVAFAGDPAAADVLFREGRAAIKRGDFAAACPKFAESQRLDPAPGTLMNLADCEEKLGKLTAAWAHYRTVMEQLRPGDDRASIVQQRWSAIDARVPRLTITLAPDAPDGSAVTRDGERLGAASLGVALPTDPGEHEIVVSSPQHRDRRFAVMLRERQAKQLEVDVGDAVREAHDSPPPVSPRSSGDSGAEPSGGQGARTAGFVLGGVGVAGLLFGGAALYEAHDSKSGSDTQYAAGHAEEGATLYRRADRWQTASIVSFVGGGALLGTGVVLLLTAPKESTTALRIAPMFAAGASGAAIVGRW